MPFIEREAAKKQIARLSQLQGFPVAPEAISELVSALGTCWTPEEAACVVDNWVQHEQYCPRPADIRKFIYDRREDREATEPAANKCRRCNGTKFVISWWLISDEHKPSGGAYRRRERLEGEVGEDSIDGANARTKMCKQLGKKQEIVEAAVMCVCHPGRG